MLVDADGLEELEPIPEEITEEPSTLNLKTMSLHLSSFSYWWLTSHCTFKAKGTIEGLELIVLVDTGVEANFLSTHIVSSLGLPLSPMQPFQVEVGNGAIELGVEGCENVKMIVQGVSIVGSLSKFEGDYQRLTLSWMSNGSRVTLQGDPSLSRSHVSGKMDFKSIEKQ